jgi:phosphohistidine phosphatase
MREILLLRHAKAVLGQAAGGDRDRDLAPRGVANASLIGRFIEEHGLAPDLALCSSARRTRRTWQLVAAELGHPSPVEDVDALYLASPEQMLRLLRGQDDRHRRLMLVGHNPGLHALALGLIAGGDPLPRQQLAAKLPTGALVHLAFELEHWEGLRPASGQIRALIRPRDLA